MKKLLLILALIGALVLAYICVGNHARQIDSDVTERMAGKMAGINLPASVDYDVDGRDVTLTGFVDDEATKMQVGKAAYEIKGVRVVHNEIVVQQADVVVIEEPVIEPAFDVPAEPTPSLIPQPEMTQLVTAPEVEVEPVAPVIEEAVIAEPVEPLPVASSCQTELAKMLEQEKINFDSGRSTIKSNSFGLLGRLAAATKNCPDAVISINGYTDSSGNSEANRQLSLNRAKSVGRYFMSKGVKQEIRVVGHGANDPVADNATPEGRAQNRRIEFKIFKPKN